MRPCHIINILNAKSIKNIFEILGMSSLACELKSFLHCYFYYISFFLEISADTTILREMLFNDLYPSDKGSDIESLVKVIG